MNAKEYLTSHWNKKQIWTHLSQPKHQERLRKCAEQMQGNTFVDVGCGSGHSTSIMAGFHPGDWTGIEFYRANVEMGRMLFPEIKFITLDHVYEMVALSFDGVVCSEVIEHVEDPLELVQSLWTMTGKVLVVTTPCVKVNDPGHLRLFDEKMIADVFAGIPYTIERTAKFFYITARR